MFVLETKSMRFHSDRHYLAEADRSSPLLSVGYRHRNYDVDGD
jgi:hypothetical protein